MSALTQIDADIFCLQEIKMERGQADIEFPNYQEYWYSADKNGYSETAVFTKLPPLAIS